MDRTKSIDLGLADEMGNAEYVAREIIEAETLVDFTPHEGLSDLFTKRFSQIILGILSENVWTFR